jgi:hypothetical protein
MHLDSARQQAYRHLLYTVFLHLRSGEREAVWWRPASWWQRADELRKLKSVADAFHNLAFFSLHDLERFDEDRFWRDIALLGRKHGADLEERYRGIFDAYVEGRTARLW